MAIFLLGAGCKSPATPVVTREPTVAALPAATATIPPAPTPTAPRPRRTPTAAAAPVTPQADPTAAPEVEPTVVEANAALPPGASANILLNGRLQDAAGNPSFDHWDQEPDYWCDWSVNGSSCNLHRPLPQSPSQTWSLQADREFRRLDTWPAACCPEAKAWTDVFDVALHNRLFFGWEELHHLYVGVVELRVYGIDAAGKMIEIFLQAGTRSAVITSKQDPPGVYLVEIPIPPGGYRGYRVEVYAKLVDEDDGILIGDFKLITAP